MARKKGSSDYSLELKLEALKLIEDGLTQAEETERLGIRAPKRENTDAYIRRLEMENALLKKFHTELHKEELAKRNIGSFTNTEKNTK